MKQSRHLKPSQHIDLPASELPGLSARYGAHLRRYGSTRLRLGRAIGADLVLPRRRTITGAATSSAYLMRSCVRGRATDRTRRRTGNDDDDDDTGDQKWSGGGAAAAGVHIYSSPRPWLGFAA